MKISQQNQTFGAIKITPKTRADLLHPTAIDAIVKSAEQADTFIGQGLKDNALSINILTKQGSEQEKNVMDKLVKNLKENFNLFKFETIEDEIATNERKNFNNQIDIKHEEMKNKKY